MVRVLIVDDSAIIREILQEILSEDPEIEVVGVAEDPFVAREMIKAVNPDVVTLDIEMPRMNGLDFLERIMRLRPQPVVMISSHVQPGALMTIRALEMGAVDVVGKPSVSDNRSLFDLGDEIIAKIKAAACAKFDTRAPSRIDGASYAAFRQSTSRNDRVIGIGASTGGVQALNQVLPLLPIELPPILIAQHMPAGFTRSFAERLDRGCALTVREAEDGMDVLPGHIYVAPGGFHLRLSKSPKGLRCSVYESSQADRHVPSVDVLFESIANVAGPRGIGVLLTGMGKDGAKGLSLMRSAGASTACQDEATSLIYGMPKAAMSCGAAECQLPLPEVVSYLLQEVAKSPRKAVQKLRAAI